MIRRPPRSTLDRSSAASDVYKRQGYTYDQIVKETRLSTRTVARIRDWMDNGAGGYQAILSGDHAHTPPVDVG